MKPFLFLLLMGCVGCGKLEVKPSPRSDSAITIPPQGSYHCDLAINFRSGKSVCFDHTDGHGNRVAMTTEESKQVADYINSAGAKQ